MSTTKKVHLEKQDRPTLMQLRRHIGTITSRQLAEQAGVPLHEEYLMELGQPVSREFAEVVINALSQLTGKRYTLADVNISLKPIDTSDEHKQALLAPIRIDSKR